MRTDIAIDRQFPIALVVSIWNDFRIATNMSPHQGFHACRDVFDQLRKGLLPKCCVTCHFLPTRRTADNFSYGVPNREEPMIIELSAERICVTTFESNLRAKPKGCDRSR